MKFLDSAAPKVDDATAATWLRECYEIEGALNPLYSDRDRNYRVETDDGQRFLLKIHNSEDDPAAIDLQVAVLDHLARRATGLNLPRTVPTANDTGHVFRDAPAGGRHAVRLLTFVAGDLVSEAPSGPSLFGSLGRAAAHLDHGLRGFFHPAAGQALVWDLRRGPALAPEIEEVVAVERREQLSSILTRFERETLPRLPGLRAQVIHNDITMVNSLTAPDDNTRVAGIIDFGDLIHAPLVMEVAVAAADVCFDCADPLAAIAALLTGYDAVMPLEAEEVDLLLELILVRHATNAVIGAWRAMHSADQDNYILGFQEPTWQALDRLLALDRAEARALLRDSCRIPDGIDRSPPPRETREALLRGRTDHYGAGHKLFYEKPLHLVAGKGVWLTDKSGRSYLDAYNNVAHVGHGHPHVVNAVRRQVASLNTNTRYLYRGLGDYCARLTALLPDPLEVCMLFSSGSEANDFAWRLARAATGNSGGLTIDDAYHGVTEAVEALSPIEWPAGAAAPAWVRGITPPYPYRAAETTPGDYLARVDRAIASLAETGLAPAGFIIDTALTSSGVLDLPEGYLAGAFARVRAAGGLCIADEVQIGFGRSGSHFWRFEESAVIPDIVTIGKPAGNGMPLSAVITTRAIFEAYRARNGLFSSVGGNPVSCAAGMAVLDVLEREDLQENALRVGAYMKQGLAALAQKHKIIGDLRGHGLLLALEFVQDRATKAPAIEETGRLVDAMAEDGVMVGAEGTLGNIIKIRPPMVFRTAHADQLLASLDRALRAL